MICSLKIQKLQHIKKKGLIKKYSELRKEKDDKLQNIITNKNVFQIEYVKAAQRLIDDRNEEMDFKK